MPVHSDGRLMMDIQPDVELPVKFRMCKPPFPEHGDTPSNWTGLAELHASASGRFSLAGLRWMKQSIGTGMPITIVDLREESHGFLNGMGISWYSEYNAVNKGFTPEEAEERERELLRRLHAAESAEFEHVEGKSAGAGLLHRNGGEWLVQSEEELVQAEGCEYARFFITDHHHPSDAETDRFLAFALGQKDRWLHVHCRGGSGRATTFFLLYDMIHNAPHVGLEEFFARHARIGGKDYGKSMPQPGNYKYKPAVERLAFIGQFHPYCLDQHPQGYAVSWSEWAAAARRADGREGC